MRSRRMPSAKQKQRRAEREAAVAVARDAALMERSHFVSAEEMAGAPLPPGGASLLKLPNADADAKTTVTVSVGSGAGAGSSAASGTKAAASNGAGDTKSAALSAAAQAPDDHAHLVDPTHGAADVKTGAIATPELFRAASDVIASASAVDEPAAEPASSVPLLTRRDVYFSRLTSGLSRVVHMPRDVCRIIFAYAQSSNTLHLVAVRRATSGDMPPELVVWSGDVFDGYMDAAYRKVVYADAANVNLKRLAAATKGAGAKNVKAADDAKAKDEADGEPEDEGDEYVPFRAQPTIPPPVATCTVAAQPHKIGWRTAYSYENSRQLLPQNLIQTCPLPGRALVGSRVRQASPLETQRGYDRANPLLTNMRERGTPAAVGLALNGGCITPAEAADVAAKAAAEVRADGNTTVTRGAFALWHWRSSHIWIYRPISAAERAQRAAQRDARRDDLAIAAAATAAAAPAAAAAAGAAAAAAAPVAAADAALDDAMANLPAPPFLVRQLSTDSKAAIARLTDPDAVEYEACAQIPVYFGARIVGMSCTTDPTQPELLVCGTDTGAMHVYDLERLQLVQCHQSPPTHGRYSGVRGILPLRDGRCYVTGAYQLYQLQTRSLPWEFKAREREDTPGDETHNVNAPKLQEPLALTANSDDRYDQLVVLSDGHTVAALTYRAEIDSGGRNYNHNVRQFARQYIATFDVARARVPIESVGRYTDDGQYVPPRTAWSDIRDGARWEVEYPRDIPANYVMTCTALYPLADMRILAWFPALELRIYNAKTGALERVMPVPSTLPPIVMRGGTVVWVGMPNQLSAYNVAVSRGAKHGSVSVGLTPYATIESTPQGAVAVAGPTGAEFRAWCVLPFERIAVATDADGIRIYSTETYLCESVLVDPRERRGADAGLSFFRRHWWSLTAIET